MVPLPNLQAYVAGHAARGAEQYRALVECTACVNERRALEGLPLLLALTFRDRYRFRCGRDASPVDLA
jgi:hypothetical protein